MLLDIFKVSLKELWRQHAAVVNDPAFKMPSDNEMFSCIELVLTKDESKVIIELFLAVFIHFGELTFQISN